MKLLAPKNHEENISSFFIKSRSSLYSIDSLSNKPFFRIIEIFRFDQRNCRRQNFEGNNIVLF